MTGGTGRGGGQGEGLGEALDAGRVRGIPHVAVAKNGPLALIWSVGSANEDLPHARLSALAACTVFDRAILERGAGFEERAGFAVLGSRVEFVVEPGPEARADLRAVAEALRSPAAPDPQLFAAWVAELGPSGDAAGDVLSFARFGWRGVGLEGCAAVLLGKRVPEDVLEWTTRHGQAHRVGLLLDTETVDEAAELAASWGPWAEAPDGGRAWRAGRAAGAGPNLLRQPPGAIGEGNATSVGTGWGLSFVVPRIPGAQEAVELFLAEAERRLGVLPEAGAGLDPDVRPPLGASVLALEHYLAVWVTPEDEGLDPLSAREHLLDAMLHLSAAGPSTQVVDDARRDAARLFDLDTRHGGMAVAHLFCAIDPLQPPPGNGGLEVPDRDALEEIFSIALMTHLFAIGPRELEQSLGARGGKTTHPVLWREEHGSMVVGEGLRYKKAAFSGAPRGYEAWDDGETLLIAGVGGEWSAIAAVVEWESGSLDVLFEDGAWPELRPEWLKGGQDLVASLRRRVPAERWVLESQLPWV